MSNWLSRWWLRLLIIAVICLGAWIALNVLAPRRGGFSPYSYGPPGRVFPGPNVIRPLPGGGIAPSAPMRSGPDIIELLKAVTGLIAAVTALIGAIGGLFFRTAKPAEAAAGFDAENEPRRRR